jgi:hypothetical protein
MLLTPNFVKALKGFFTMLLVLYLITIVLQFSGISGIRVNDTNSFFRIFINQFYQFLFTLAFWLAVFFITRDKRAFLAVMILQTVVFLYAVYSFSSSPDEKAVYNSLMFVHRGANIISYALLGILHFRSVKGLYLVFAWVIVFGLSSGPWFSSSMSYFNKFLNMIDLERMFTVSLPGEEGRYRYVDFLRPIYGQLYLLFDLIIFWFVYSLIKADNPTQPGHESIDLLPDILATADHTFYHIIRSIKSSSWYPAKRMDRDRDAANSSCLLFHFYCRIALQKLSHGLPGLQRARSRLALLVSEYTDP